MENAKQARCYFQLTVHEKTQVMLLCMGLPLQDPREAEVSGYLPAASMCISERRIWQPWEGVE